MVVMIKCIKVTWTLMLCITFGQAQPVACTDDIQCSVGYFCNVNANICRECLRCEDFQRENSNSTKNTCIKSVDSCGPCFKGLINIYGNLLKGKCVTSEPIKFNQLFFYGYVVAAVITVLIVTLIIYMWQRVVPYPHVLTINSKSTSRMQHNNEKSVVPRLTSEAA